VAELVGTLCGFDANGSYPRVEYIQDTDGAWLRPHCDVRQKQCSILIYLGTGPDAAEWGTDMYDGEGRWLARVPSDFNSAAIFLPTDGAWHGFEKRKIVGIRRAVQINYAHPSWRDKNQLCFPDRPIALS
jgi:hypothetical protein